MAVLRKVTLILITGITAFTGLQAQTINTALGSYVVTTAVPFLRITPDARAGGMGDVGIATPVDANGLYANPAKMAFLQDGKEDYGFALSFSPWLKALVNDIYLASLNGYIKVKKQQTISMSLRYFSLGNIQFTDVNGVNTQQFMPREFAIDVAYSRKLGDYFSIAASLRYIYSNLASGQNVNGSLVRPGQAGAGDISWYFHRTYNENNEMKMQHTFSCGMNLSNIGSKMSYTSSVVKDFLPTNLGIGFGYTLDVDKHSSVGAYLDFNKLLVPTPNGNYDSANANYYWREESAVKGMFTSFGDAPAKIILGEITTGIGMEYFYNKQFGVRFGYFYESPTDGGRQFLEAGLTVKYSIVGLHFSYLIPTTIIRSPLDNTLRFSLIFDFKKGGNKGSNNSGVSFVDDTPKKKKAAPANAPPAPAPGQPQPAPADQGAPK